MTVDEYINRQTPEIHRLLAQIRRLILEASPKVQEKISWGVPFYFHKGHLVYLNPLRTPEAAVDICFLRGYELANEQGVLEGRGRRTVKSVIVQSGDFNEDTVRELLQEAILLNETSKEKPAAFHKKRG
ncbi:DUF1801 domain-containing protein [Larkinella rosea]|uniref:DUF1801 domain-containing protein n=1 Tax=Larkinella rosea TaxID=2025312 RepID=A0A3P1BP52_9BACT|nr:DUF1801 domain-containing protein [Larkinella rosea]RRB02828.1 DUF1801 domain-containing protein [Larkinella rosea]